MAWGWAPGSISPGWCDETPGQTDGHLAIRLTMTSGVIVPQNKDENAIP